MIACGIEKLQIDIDVVTDRRAGKRRLEDRLAGRRAIEQMLTHGSRSDRFLRPLLKASLMSAGLYGRGARNALDIHVRHAKLAFRDLPQEFCGFRILHLADLHIDGIEGLAEVVGEIVSEMPVDLCVMTGDYRYETQGSCTAVYPGVRKIISNVVTHYGTVAILGNHDAAEIAIEFEQNGIRMLVNEALELRRQGASMWVVGVDDPFHYQCDDLPLAVNNVPAKDFKILLSHTPELFKEASRTGIDLYLAGHTHGGQIRLPFFGSVVLHGNCPREFTHGHWQYRQMQGYTSAGVGCSMLPVRFNCPPEIVLVELTKTS